MIGPAKLSSRDPDRLFRRSLREGHHLHGGLPRASSVTPRASRQLVCGLTQTIRNPQPSGAAVRPRAVLSDWLRQRAADSDRLGEQRLHSERLRTRSDSGAQAART